MVFKYFLLAKLMVERSLGGAWGLGFATEARVLFNIIRGSLLGAVEGRIIEEFFEILSLLGLGGHGTCLRWRGLEQ